jgi:glycosyltransferase involved in cell wall biosynthesis
MKKNWLKSMVRAIVPLDARNWIRTQRSNKSSAIKRFVRLKKDFRNREGLKNFDFTLFESRGTPGVSAMLRVKNESEKILNCLRSISDIFDEIIFVDNGSEDKTLEILRQFKEETDKGNKIKIYHYPFKIARCGQENLLTPEDSLSSLAYYYNWTLSKCTFRYICKWDADMILRKEAREPIKRFLRQIQRDQKKCWALYGQTIYRDLRGNYYLSKGEVNSEIRIFPYGFNPRFGKVELYEALKFERPLPVEHFDAISFYELKFVNENEFSHWSTDDIPPTPRKKREWENFYLIRTGNIDSARFEKLSLSFVSDEVI